MRTKGDTTPKNKNKSKQSTKNQAKTPYKEDSWVQNDNQ